MQQIKKWIYASVTVLGAFYGCTTEVDASNFRENNNQKCSIARTMSYTPNMKKNIVKEEEEEEEEEDFTSKNKEDLKKKIAAAAELATYNIGKNAGALKTIFSPEEIERLCVQLAILNKIFHPEATAPADEEEEEEESLDLSEIYTIIKEANDKMAQYELNKEENN